MNAQQIVVQFYLALESAKAKNLVERTRVAARAAGATFTNSEASAWLSKFTSVTRAKREAKGHFAGSTPTNGQVSDGHADGLLSTIRTDGRTENGLTRVKGISESLVLFPNGKSPEVPKPKKTAKPKPSTAWVGPLRAEVAVLEPKQLRHLSADERHVLARCHALEFGNCTVSETTNRSKATGVASGLVYLVRDIERNPSTVDITAREYLVYARRVWERRGRSPWFQPRDILAEVELESVVRP